MKPIVKTYILKAIALLVLVILYSLTVPKKLSVDETKILAADFKFKTFTLYEPINQMPGTIRKVHPQYEKINAWISSVGAGNALTDYDGDGLPNDLIHVDPRYDKVFVEPVPGTKNDHHNYQSFSLDVKSLPYDAETMAPMGAIANDYNEDGKMDVLVYYWGRTPVIFYQTENGIVEKELINTTIKYNSNAGTLADFDGDGHIDIFIGNYFPDNGKVLDSKATDQDQVMQHSMSRGDNGAKGRLFLWKGMKDGFANFEEQKNWDDGIDNPLNWTLAVGAADINGDLLPELYIANDFGEDKLLYNQSTLGHVKFKQLRGVKHFNTIGSAIVGKDSFKGMGVTFADINGDGLLDIYVSNIAEEWALFESHFVFICTGEFDKMKDGYAPYVNKSEEMGLSRSYWSWDNKLADFNNDGELEALQTTGFVKGYVDRWPELQELAMGNDELLAKPAAWPLFKDGIDLSGDAHVPFFVKSKSGKYFDISNEIGNGNEQISRGIAVADVEHDGDLDYALANQWQPSHFFQNNYNGGNSFLGLTLLFPTQSNQVASVIVDGNEKGRYAIGAEVNVKLPDGKTMVSFVDGGNGHSGKNASELFFGLGKLGSEKLNVEIKYRMSNGKENTAIIETTAGWHKALLPY